MVNHILGGGGTDKTGVAISINVPTRNAVRNIDIIRTQSCIKYYAVTKEYYNFDGLAYYIYILL